MNYLYFLGDLPSEYINNEFLDNLYTKNYADLILSNIEQKGIEQIRSELQAAFSSWMGNLSLAPYVMRMGLQYLLIMNSNGLEDDMIDYFDCESFDLSLTNTYSEKLYELGILWRKSISNFLNEVILLMEEIMAIWDLTPSSGGMLIRGYIIRYAGKFFVCNLLRQDIIS